MALDKGYNDNFHAFILLSRYCVSHYTQKHAGCKPWEKQTTLRDILMLTTGSTLRELPVVNKAAQEST